MIIQLDIPKDREPEIQSLMKATGAETPRELFNNALTLLDWAVKTVKEGREVAEVDETSDEYRVLSIPSLKYAARAKPLSPRSQFQFVQRSRRQFEMGITYLTPLEAKCC